MTEDTQSCYEEGIDNYYLDKNDFKLKKCHKNCLRCSTRATNDTYMNCLKCQPNLFMTEDTQSCYEDVIDNYYLDKIDNILRRCHPNCLKCKSAQEDETHMNCLKCQANLYMTKDTESCYEGEIDNYYLDKNDLILKPCHKNCLRCKSSPISDLKMRCKNCQPKFYLTEDKDSCYDYIPDNYYLGENDILRKCYKTCFNCLGAKNSETMNCLSCISDEYFYKNDTKDCILFKDYKKRIDLEFTKVNNYNFYIFIIIFVAALIIFGSVCAFYKIKEQNKKMERKEQPEQKEEKKKSEENKKQDENVEMIELKPDLKGPINDDTE